MCRFLTSRLHRKIPLRSPVEVRENLGYFQEKRSPTGDCVQTTKYLVVNKVGETSCRKHAGYGAIVDFSQQTGRNSDSLPTSSYFTRCAIVGSSESHLDDPHVYGVELPLPVEACFLLRSRKS